MALAGLLASLRGFALPVKRAWADSGRRTGGRAGAGGGAAEDLALGALMGSAGVDRPATLRETGLAGRELCGFGDAR